MSAVERLIFQSEGQPGLPSSVLTHAGFHHRSINTTWLQHVKFRPVLPALNEIKMTRTFGSVLIVSRLSWRFSFRIAPSSANQLGPAHTNSTHIGRIGYLAL